jgi:hypothetical protein
MLQIIMRKVEIGSTIEDSLLPFSVTVQHLCLALQSPFKSPNIESGNSRSRISHVKQGVAQQIVIFYLSCCCIKQTHK